MKLIFEKGTPGRHCHLLPDCDVPVHQIGVGRKEKLNLPELSENDISRHYTGLAGAPTASTTVSTPLAPAP